MTSPPKTVPLGFTEEEFPPGTHICQIYGDDDERNDTLLAFLTAGLEAGEKTACFSEKVTGTVLAAGLAAKGHSFDELEKRGALGLSGTNDAYFEGGRFDPDRMLSVLENYSNQARDEGYSGSRVIGEMVPEIKAIPGGDRLLEYESRVTLLLKDHPVTAVCQYDAHAFDGAALMDVLKVHPLMIIKGRVVRNPFYIPPDEFLEGTGI